ncbi:MAG TPA: D-glycerate dehydrogenase [Chitinophaga sp.]|uniref:2-hydroxyacid dehydrogenase n=1 Tax=Chitinophaga sp. TaxID=1869181 RepID=UPI002BB8B8B0|nr:D-glycerate dehydrogenase [Chitinophaga sp.]HVI44086.1 D-glycerate dehydrogenase [Chitinophaga sp.]
MKIFITRVLPPEGLALLQRAAVNVTQWEEKRNLSREELIAHCQQYDALLLASDNIIDRGFLQQCGHLKVISLLSVGYDKVDIQAANELKVPVTNTPGVLSSATADTAFLLMLAASRKAFFQHKRIIRGEWGFSEPTANLGIEIEGKTLGIWGLGNIGYVMAQRCISAFNMRVIYCNRGRNEEAEQKLGAVRVSFDELLSQSDVLSVHTALTPETAGTFNMAAFSKMKPTSIFVNTARGAIHNEADLITALQQRIIWGAGLDVTNPEPMSKDNPLLDMPTVAVLPHIGSATEETRNAMAVMAAKNIIAAMNGEPLPNQVTSL